MKKVFVCALGIAMLAMSLPAAGAVCTSGGRVWDDLSWWGNSGATPAPVKAGPSPCNGAERSGYWWWPTEAASNAGDAELWGNRGVVYAMYTPAAEPPPPPPPAPGPDKPGPTVRPTPVLNDVLFDFDKSNIKPEAAATLNTVVESMKKFTKDTLVIEGHTCNVGEEAYNMGLGQRRADSVQKYLVENGVDAARVTTQSFGETQPAVPNDTPANRKLNRRAVFKMTIVNE